MAKKNPYANKQMLKKSSVGAGVPVKAHPLPPVGTKHAAGGQNLPAKPAKKST